MKERNVGAGLGIKQKLSHSGEVISEYVDVDFNRKRKPKNNTCATQVKPPKRRGNLVNRRKDYDDCKLASISGYKRPGSQKR